MRAQSTDSAIEGAFLSSSSRSRATVGRLRELELKKAPSIAESVDWARTLVALQVGDLDEATVARTLGVVLKHASDQQRAARELKLAAR